MTRATLKALTVAQLHNYEKLTFQLVEHFHAQPSSTTPQRQGSFDSSGYDFGHTADAVLSKRICSFTETKLAFFSCHFNRPSRCWGKQMLLQLKLNGAHTRLTVVNYIPINSSCKCTQFQSSPKHISETERNVKCTANINIIDVHFPENHKLRLTNDGTWIGEVSVRWTCQGCPRNSVWISKNERRGTGRNLAGEFMQVNWRTQPEMHIKSGTQRTKPTLLHPLEPAGVPLDVRFVCRNLLRQNQNTKPNCAYVCKCL